jgi:hypothetical protein
LFGSGPKTDRGANADADDADADHEADVEADAAAGLPMLEELPLSDMRDTVFPLRMIAAAGDIVPVGETRAVVVLVVVVVVPVMGVAKSSAALI